MKERSIIVDGESVRAILSGAKTQVRPVIAGTWLRCLNPEDIDDRAQALAQSPFQKGGRLWVKEGWSMVHPIVAEGRPSKPHPTCGIPGPPRVDYRVVVYRADGNYPAVRHILEWPFRAIAKPGDHLLANECGWYPSSTMTREISRLALEITDVRVQRLYELTEPDAAWESYDPRRESTWVWAVSFRRVVTLMEPEPPEEAE